MVSTRRSAAILLALAVVGGAIATAVGQREAYVEAPIRYWDAPQRNAVTRLSAKISEGAITPEQPDERGFLREVLVELGIPTASQTLVFSKTSHQNALISPRSPRAIYFSDDVYVGWVPGGAIEIAATDPQLGAVFYLVSPPEQPDGGITLSRPRGCLSCHAGAGTRDNPGFMVRSVFPDESGLPILSQGSYLSTHDSPLSERWGGWYVSGRHGSQRHMGNVIAEEIDGHIAFDPEAGANVTDLSPYFDTGHYLESTSDILALMVLEHQVEMHNLLHRASYAVRQGLYRQAAMADLFGEQGIDEPQGSTLSLLKSHAEKILRHMLFADEIELVGGGIDSDGPFREAFLAGRKTDARGRSLKDFQLLDRIFKYRCSYMIYSAAFENLPPALKTHIYGRLHEILDSHDPDGSFAHLGESERGKIKSILLATEPGFAAASPASAFAD